MRRLFGLVACGLGLLILVPIAGIAALVTPPPAPPVEPGSEAPSALALAEIPPFVLSIYQSAAPTCPGLPWPVLAAIGKVESNHGKSQAPGVQSGANFAGAMGPMQFLAGTWAGYGVDADGDGFANPYSPVDSVYGAARYLCANGGGDPARLPMAIWNYNRAWWYVEKVLAIAAAYTEAPSPPTTEAPDILTADPVDIPQG